MERENAVGGVSPGLGVRVRLRDELASGPDDVGVAGVDLQVEKATGRRKRKGPRSSRANDVEKRVASVRELSLPEVQERDVEAHALLDVRARRPQ